MRCGWRRHETDHPHAPAKLGCHALHSGDTMGLDILTEAPQRAEDLFVVRIVGSQLNAIALCYGERDFEDVDRVESQPLCVKRRLWRDFGGSDLKVQCADDELR